jgi:hypothetical protein
LTAIEGELFATAIGYGERHVGETRLFVLGEDLPDLITVRTESQDGSARLAADIAVADWAEGTPELAVTLSLGADRLASLSDFIPMPDFIDGAATIDLSVVGPLDAISDPSSFPLAGDIAVTIHDGSVPGLLDDVAATIFSDVVWDGTSLALTGTDRWQVGGWLSDLDQPFTVSLAPVDDVMGLRLDANGRAGAVDAQLQVSVGGIGAISAAVDIAVEDFGLPDQVVDIRTVEGTVSPVDLGGLAVTPLEISLSGVGRHDRFDGAVSAIVAANGTSPGISVANGVVIIDGRIESDFADVMFFAEGCQTFAFDRLSIERTPLQPIGGPFCLEGVAGRPLFVLPTSLAGVASIEAIIPGIAARIDPEASPLDATIGELRIAGSLIDGVALDLELVDASLDIPNDGILIAGH